MKLEQQVTSLELSRRLKELGVKQRDCLFAHYFNAGEPTLGIVDAYMYKDMDDEYWAAKLVAAFTVAELGEMLPSRAIFKEGDSYSSGMLYHHNPAKGLFQTAYVIGNLHRIIHSYAEHTEADARAKMLIYLLENKLVTL